MSTCNLKYKTSTLIWYLLPGPSVGAKLTPADENYYSIIITIYVLILLFISKLCYYFPLLLLIPIV